MTTLYASDTSIGDALLTFIMGYAIVFVGLIFLMAVIYIVGRIMVAKKKAAPKATAAPAAPAAPKAPVEKKLAPGSAGEIKLYNVDDRTAAMVMAITANKLQKPLNELRFKSIKEVE